ncbi:MAG: FAD-binding and (Fe-S)-binding domain-containing protein [Gulosibacter sp.]|uniref:FAD-binding and (Fe-S)-binding domain-containing protein n=1 Tax=Gulosibacter sp. TaxID=2817531 RepID=UPI003F936358
MQQSIGSGVEIDTAEHRLQAYSYDASNYRVRPTGVVFPKDVAEVRQILRDCNRAGIAVTVRGGGTSMAGNAIGEGLVLDLSRHLGEIGVVDEQDASVWADAGVVLGELRSAVERETEGHLTFAPDPSSVSRATIGGSIGNDACGNHSVAYGRMSHHVHEVELLTIDGAHLWAGQGGVSAVDSDDSYSAQRAEQIDRELRALAEANLAALRIELETMPRQVSGFHLGQLLPENGFDVARALAGSEGTCAIVVRAKVGLVAKPAATALLCLGYASTVDSARDVMPMLALKPTAFEGLDAQIVEIMRHRRGADAVSLLPAGEAYALVEFSADSIEEASAQCERAAQSMLELGRLRDFVIVTEPAERAKLWRIREDGAGLSSKRIDNVQTWPGWEDSAVAPAQLADYLAELLPLIEKHGYTTAMYGHFGAGCVHMRVDFDLRSDAGQERFLVFMREAATLVVQHGGSLSGEHGDGRARGELLELMYSPQLMRAFAEFKRIWDPKSLLNPGIIIDPVPFAENLALTGLPLADDPAAAHGEQSAQSPGARIALPLSVARREPVIGTFVGNAHACIGVGRCRATSGGFMCPSYRATQDEKDSTRGRARVLQELVRTNGRSAGGWQQPEVREALDLCLSCKACSADCPTGVDIAEAKSELLDDHYRGKLRPFTHYSIGWLPRWLPILSRVSTLANIGANLPIARWIADKLGISKHRKLPAFRPHADLKRRVREANFARDATSSILVFADSFTKAFRPEVIPAAKRVLGGMHENVGCTPDACCGLTWISTGQRQGAAKRLANLVRKFDDGSDRDIVVLEPSCAAAIRDDGPKLLGTEASRRVASRVKSFSVAVDDVMRAGWRPSTKAPEQAVLQTHCHEHAVFGAASQRRVLEQWGVNEVAESSSCCGVAGNFGFERDHFDVSMKVAEHSIVPALERGGEGALVLTDGFSCHMQVGQLDASESSVHLAVALDSNTVSQ